MPQAYELFSKLSENIPTDDQNFTKEQAENYLQKLKEIATKIQSHLIEIFEATGEHATFFMGTCENLEFQEFSFQWMRHNLSGVDEDNEDIENAVEQLRFVGEEIDLSYGCPGECEINVTKDKISIKFSPFVRQTLNMSVAY